MMTPTTIILIVIATILAMITIFAMVSMKDDYDKKIDDEDQLKYLKKYNEKHN